MTLKAYSQSCFETRLLFYPEGGRSYSGEIKPPKTGLLHAALLSEPPGLMIVPTAISYDFVLEDHVLSRQGVKRNQRPFARELAEMVRYAVGYRSRAFVTFGRPIPLDGWDPESRRDVIELGRLTRAAIGKLVKALPTASSRRRCGRRFRGAIWNRAPTRSSRPCAPWGPIWGSPPGDRRSRRPPSRWRLAESRLRPRTFQRARPQRLSLLRADDRTSADVRVRPHPLMLDVASKAFFQTLSYSRTLKKLASRYGMSGPTRSRAGSSPARPSPMRSALFESCRHRGS